MDAQSNMSNGGTSPQSTEQGTGQVKSPAVPLPIPPINLPQNLTAAQLTGQSVAAAPTPQTYQVPTSQTIAPDVAEDTDLIEKEWVDKAKQIVERTRDDPYEQSKELTLFKADYMKKRYNRTIKIDE